MISTLQGFIHYWADAWIALTALGTLALAIATFRVIRQGQQQRRDAERQHQDRFKPICVLAPYDGVDPWDQRGALIRANAPTPSANKSFGTIEVHCILQNVGTGPALNLKLKFRFLDMDGLTTDPWELSPIGAGEKVGGEGKPLRVPFRLYERFTPTDFASLEGKPWEIWLEYQDVFENRFCTIHSKSALNINPATFDWATPPGGDTPKASMPTIPWVTFTEGAGP
jgi:hypothetical protein